jgi:hypothetical protein
MNALKVNKKYENSNFGYWHYVGPFSQIYSRNHELSNSFVKPHVFVTNLGTLIVIEMV